MPIADLHMNDAGGITKGKPSGGFNKRNMMGTLEYMAPETLQKQLPSQKSDVWALAVMLNEVATGTFPYSDCTQENPAAHTVLEMGYGRCVNHSSSATHETACLGICVHSKTAAHRHCQGKTPAYAQQRPRATSLTRLFRPPIAGSCKIVHVTRVVHTTLQTIVSLTHSCVHARITCMSAVLCRLVKSASCCAGRSWQLQLLQMGCCP